MNNTPFQLVPEQISHDTTEALRVLHAHAQEGKIIGVTFAAMYRGRFFVADSAGECYQNPVWTLGMLDILKSKLRKLASIGKD